MKISAFQLPRISLNRMPFVLLLPLLILVFAAIPGLTQCNGEERWAVKTGSDLDVSKVKTTPTLIAISVMNSWNNSQPYS